MIRDPETASRVRPLHLVAAVARLGLRGSIGMVRLAIASAVIGATAYVLGWRILYGGPAGSDAGFHLNLIGLVARTFPALGWWDPFDDLGIPYRLGYPLASHWIVVLVSSLSGLSLFQGIQVVEFAINPLCALGVYAFCAWRLRSPLTGLVAAFLFLLSPLTWTSVVDGGVFSNQAGTVLFMPFMLALDACFEEWEAGRRGRRFRVAFLATAGLMALMGLLSPFQLGASVAAALAYALAIRPGGTARARLRWLLLAAPALLLVAFLLTAFWSLPEQRIIAFIGSRAPPRVYSPPGYLLTPWRTFALQPIDTNRGDGHRSFSLAVTLPAVLGALAAVRDRRARVLVALVGYGLLTMFSDVLGMATWRLPVLSEVVHFRSGVTIVQFLVPVLAGIGLVRLPAALGAAAGARLPLGRPGRTAVACLAVAAGLAVGAAGVYRFAYWTQGASRLAYGAYMPAGNSIWMPNPPRRGPWPVASQLEPVNWRPPFVGCAIPVCIGDAAKHQAQAAAFPPRTQRAVEDAHVPWLLMDYNGMTGGSQAYTYNFQLPTSPELQSWMLDAMLAQPGTVAKEQLAQTIGASAVGLGDSEAAMAPDYAAMGWSRRVAASGSPIVYTNPHPTGLAAEWPGGAAVLVVGGDQVETSHPYNDVFKAATSGMIPYQEGWLVRGGSPYVDDHSLTELRQYRALLLLGYRYHDRDAAWNLLDAYVRAGGSLYVETGWQFVDPDWDASAAPSLLPVSGLGWRNLDPRSATSVDGTVQPGWGAYRYDSSGWGANVATGARKGAESVVSSGGRVVAARWRVGAGRVFWSGGNLLAHATGDRSAAEAAYLAEQWRWLLQPTAPPDEKPIAWAGTDQVSVSLAASTVPTWVLVKESMVPGWSAELVTPEGTRQVEVGSGEMDFILVRLDSVAAGSRLVMTFGPTATVYVSWTLSLVALLGLAAWVVRPDPFEALAARLRRRAAALARRVAANWGQEDA